MIGSHSPTLKHYNTEQPSRLKQVFSSIPTSKPLMVFASRSARCIDGQWLSAQQRWVKC